MLLDTSLTLRGPSGTGVYLTHLVPALEAAGIEVVPIAGSELGSGRGGPRCMSCPVSRDPL